MDFSVLVVYCVTILAVSVIPGPSMALAFSHGMRYGLRGVVPAAIGNVAATLLQGVIAMLAIHSLVAVDPRVLNVLQLLGAGYLGYIAVIFIRERVVIGRKISRLDEVRGAASSRFVEGVIIALFNPKAILFFVALFPQFVNGQEADIVAYAEIFIPIGLVALSCFMLYGALGCAAVGFFNGERLASSFAVAAGVLLLLIALSGLVDAVRSVLSELL